MNKGRRNEDRRREGGSLWGMTGALSVSQSHMLTSAELRNGREKKN